MFAAVQDVVIMVVGTVILVVAGVLAARIQPHWVSKDGLSFTCRVQPIGKHGETQGRELTARALITDDRVVLTPRGLSTIRPHSRYVVARRGEPVRKRSVSFLLTSDAGLAALEVPESSLAAVRLDELVAHYDG